MELSVAVREERAMVAPVGEVVIRPRLIVETLTEEELDDIVDEELDALDDVPVLMAKVVVLPLITVTVLLVSGAFVGATLRS